MNISTTPRRVAQGLLALFFTLATTAGVRAQCSDFVSFPADPVVINLTLSAGGTVNLTNAVLNANGFTKNGACDFWLSTNSDPLNLGAYNNTPINFTCADVATSPQTWYVRVGGLPLITDDMGPGATVVPITINVIDNIPPTITCIANQMRPADGACTYTAVGVEFDWLTANDNCATNISYSLSGATSGNGGSTLAGVVFGVGPTTVTWTVQDNALPVANQATCSFTVTVNDMTPPMITCPANVVHPNAPANASCQWVGTGLEVTNAMVSDNCATDAALLATLTNSVTGLGHLNGYAFPLGVTNVTYTINDGVNPPVNCMFSVDVTDQTNPVITCPMPMTVNAAGSPACDYTVVGTGFDATATDNCSIMAGTPSNDYNASTTLNGAVFSVGTTTVTWSVTDGSGNMATCSFNVTVNDVTPPTVVALPPGIVTFQPLFVVNTAPGSCSQSVSWYRPSQLTHAAADCNGPVTLTENPTVQINCPGLSCVNDPNFFVDNGVTPYPYDENNPLHWVTPVSANFPVGTTVITYEFEDFYGNITPVTVTVVVNELENPDANCVTGPVAVALDPLLGVAVITPALINNGSTDNCGIMDMTVSPSVLDCSNLGTNMVTLTVTDNASNTGTCTTTVFLVDNTLPVIGCPSSFVVPANSNCQATVPSLIFNVGSSSPAVMEYFDNALDPCGLSFDYNVNGGAFTNLGLFVSNPVNLSAVVFPAGNNAVTLRATDGSGNITVCNFTVNVQDQMGPTYATPVNPGPAAGDIISANMPNIGSCSAKATWNDPVFIDNCPGAVTIVSQTAFSGITNFSADNGGLTPVTYVFKDAAGNLTNHTFFVHVTDNQAPVANCKNITVNLSSTIGAGSVVVAPAQIDNLSTDNCGYFYTSGNVTYTCANLGTNNYTLQIQDAAGNMASCVGVVTVQDVTAPTFNCPANVTVNANASCLGIVSGTSTATDNCAIVQYEYDLDPPAGVAFTLLNNGATGNLANIPALPLGVNIVTLRASDASGNSSTCSYTVTVQDVTPPVLAGVPANVTVNCDAIPPIANPTATDNCGTANVAFVGQVFGPGTCTFTITRTWMASDNAVPANTATASQVITVQDVTGPVFSAAFLPSGMVNINVAGPSICTGNYTLNVVNTTDIFDACNGVSGITYNLVPASGAPSMGVLTLASGVYTLPVTSFPIGTNVVTLTASDGCGNTTTKVVNIVVADNQAPIFQNNYAVAPIGRCGQVYTLPNTTNNCDQLFTWSRPILGDITDCGNFTVTESISNQTVQAFINLLNPFGPSFPPASPGVIAQFPVGETTVTYTATQGANVSTCSFIVKILDTQAPSITCPGNQEISISSACAQLASVPIYLPTSIIDNCINNVVVSQTPAAGTLLSAVVPLVEAGETFDVTLNAKDSLPNGLMAVPCTFTVTLIDSQSPQPLENLLDDIVSNCTKDTVIAPGATDCNGVSIDTLWGTPSVSVMEILPPLYPGGPPRYVLNPGIYVITWSYTDPQNNTTTQPQSVFITVDLTPPVAVAQPLNINLDAMGNAFVTAQQLNNGSFDPDNCGPITLSIRTGVGPNFTYVDTLDLDCSNLGVNNVVFAVTDINNNTATFQTTVTVNDVTPPFFVNAWTAGQMDTVIQACSPIPDADDYPQTAADQCDLVPNIQIDETSTQTPSGCGKYAYIINRKWTATDDSGNSTTRTQKIIVTDTQAPVFAANTPATVVGNTAPNAIVCNAAVNFNMANFVTDCQDSVDLTITNALISAPIGNTFVIPTGPNISAPNYPVGTYVVRFTATDNCGNSSTRDVTIQVNDVTPPTAVCINGVSASLQPSGTVTVTFNQFNNNSYDNCTPTDSLSLLIQRLDLMPLEPPTASLDFNCDDADGVTQHPVKLMVTDLIGNMSMCLTYIVIQDNVAPTITCPPSKTVQCTDVLTPAAQGVATAVDNCPVLPNSITHTDAIGGGVGNICQVLTRTWKAVDLANNMSTCNQLLSIQDTVKPVFTILPPDITVSCSDGSIDIVPVSATDNCDANVLVVLTVDTLTVAQGDCGLFDYTIVRTWTATDNCGNTNVHTRQIKVVDITDPVFAGMPDTIIIKSSQFPPNLDCTVPLTLNVLQFLEDCSPDSLLLVTNDAPFGNQSNLISGNYPIGQYMVNFAAIDACGNVGIDSVLIIVEDNSVPTMVCNNNVVIALGTNGEATIFPGDINIGSFDNCAIDTLVLSQSTFDCGDLGFNDITLTATDIYGNTNFCAVTVEVTLGNNTGFNLSTSATNETYLGADNGMATAIATGGTGTFSYLWSTNDTTDVIGNLPAGTYTVTATDVNSGCISTSTVVVSAGPTVTVNIGTADGCQNAVIVVPVTVDNFISVSGFSIGFDLSNGLVGAITAITDVNPALVGLTPGVNTVFWSEPNLNGITLPNGTLLFNLNITLSNAPQGTTSAIVEGLIPGLLFLQDGTNQAPAVNFNNGAVTISCVVNDLQIAGDVFTWRAPVKAVPDVTLNLTGTINGVDVTALPDADYSFFVPSGANTVVTPDKVNTIKNQQINVGDMLAIQAHAAQQVSFTSGYQWVAADVNNDQRVNLADYALVQKYVLGNNAHFTDNTGLQVGPDWKFIPEVFMFGPLPIGNPQAPMLNPLNDPIPPATIPRNNVMMNFLDDDFVAVLMGDVNGSVTFFSGGGGNESPNALKFRLDNRALQAGEIVTIPFKAVDFVKAQAYQLTIGFDPTVLELQDVHEGVLPGVTLANFGTDHLVDGLLSTLWVGGKPLPVNDNETLFSLTFRVLKSTSALSNVLHSSSDLTEALAIDQSGITIGVDFEFVTTVATGDLENKVFALYQNQPNPFNDETSISFRLPEAGRATLRVFSVEGRLVKTVIGEFAEGTNYVTFRKGDLGGQGVYYYELETPKHSARKKMILID